MYIYDDALFLKLYKPSIKTKKRTIINLNIEKLVNLELRYIL